jgi:hypothetical protein
MTTVATILKDLGIDEKDAIREYALFNASQKAAEFAQECEAFEGKYNMPFSEFEKKVNERQEEVFSEEDDYLAWKFAVEGALYWREKIAQLKSSL